MNIFRLAGDMSHLLAIMLLLAKIWKSKSVVGLSGKSQVRFWYNLYGISYTLYVRLNSSDLEEFKTELLNRIKNRTFSSEICASIFKNHKM